MWRYKKESEWQRNEAPHLRIIDDVVFDEAQRVRGQRARAHGRARSAPKRILSGLLRCGACGAGMSKKDNDHGRPRIVCTQMREAGSCSHRRNYYLDEIERIVVGGLREELGTREAITHFVHCYNDERRRASTDTIGRRRALEAEIAIVERQIERAVAAMIQGRITEDEAAAHLPSLRQRRAELAVELATIASPPIVVALRPAALDNYLRDLERLEEVINADLAAGDDGAARAIRGMIDTVTVVPTPAGSVPGIIVRGGLARLVGLEPLQKGSYFGGNGGAG
jgi:hypothetical protein